VREREEKNNHNWNLKLTNK